MPAKYRGNASSLTEMLGQGLQEIASYLRCVHLTDDGCKEYLKQAFPSAPGNAVNAAWRWVSRAQSAARDFDTGRSRSASEYAADSSIPAGNRYKYDVLVITGEGDDSEERTRIKIYSNDLMSYDDLRRKAYDETLRKWAEQNRGTNSPSPDSPPPTGIDQLYILTVTRR